MMPFSGFSTTMLWYGAVQRPVWSLRTAMVRYAVASTSSSPLCTTVVRYIVAQTSSSSLRTAMVRYAVVGDCALDVVLHRVRGRRLGLPLLRSISSSRMQKCIGKQSLPDTLLSKTSKVYQEATLPDVLPVSAESRMFGPPSRACAISCAFDADGAKDARSSLFRSRLFTGHRIVAS